MTEYTDIMERLRQASVKERKKCISEDGTVHFVAKGTWHQSILGREAAEMIGDLRDDYLRRHNEAADNMERALVAESRCEKAEAERDEARNDEWIAAISAVQYMEANWLQDCRSEAERQALMGAAAEIIGEMKRSGPTEYLDLKWKDAEAAVAAESRCEDLVKALERIVDRSENGELGTSKVQDMKRIAVDALSQYRKGSEADG